MERTQVAIIGAGPAGLLLSHLLHGHGIDTIVLEAKSRAYAEARIRAGVLENGTVETLNKLGLGERLQREGLAHRGIHLSFGGQRHHVDLEELTGGRRITVYGQHEVVKDLIAARLAAGGDVRFETEVTAIEGVETELPRLSCRSAGGTVEISCDFIAGCDGFHGIARNAIPASALTLYERIYPFAWLGILAEAPPALDELVYARHTNGFALFSMRSHDLTRLYLQCTPDEDLDAWPDDRIWRELHLRLEGSGDWRVNEGRIVQKGVTRDAQFRRGTHAVRALVPGRRCSAYRAAYRRQRHEPRRRRCTGALRVRSKPSIGSGGRTCSTPTRARASPASGRRSGFRGG